MYFVCPFCHNAGFMPNPNTEPFPVAIEVGDSDPTYDVLGIGVPGGSAFGRVERRGNITQAFLDGIAVTEGKGCGKGTTLVRAFIREARQRGATELWARATSTEFMRILGRIVGKEAVEVPSQYADFDAAHATLRRFSAFQADLKQAARPGIGVRVNLADPLVEQALERPFDQMINLSQPGSIGAPLPASEGILGIKMGVDNFLVETGGIITGIKAALDLVYETEGSLAFTAQGSDSEMLGATQEALVASKEHLCNCLGYFIQGIENLGTYRDSL